jgi:hypothetical protein
MSRLCEKYKYLKINKGYNSVKFSVDDIFKPRNETNPEDGGFHISTHIIC